MLARSFKIAAELGILETDYDALIKTLFAFERGEIHGHREAGLAHDSPR